MFSDVGSVDRIEKNKLFHLLNISVAVGSGRLRRFPTLALLSCLVLEKPSSILRGNREIQNITLTRCQFDLSLSRSYVEYCCRSLDCLCDREPACCEKRQLPVVPEKSFAAPRITSLDLRVARAHHFAGRRKMPKDHEKKVRKLNICNNPKYATKTHASNQNPILIPSHPGYSSVSSPPPFHFLLPVNPLDKLPPPSSTARESVSMAGG